MAYPFNSKSEFRTVRQESLFPLLGSFPLRKLSALLLPTYLYALHRLRSGCLPYITHVLDTCANDLPGNF